MKYFTILKGALDRIKPFNLKSTAGDEYSLRKSGSDIELTCNSMAAFAVYYYKDDTFFAFTNNFNTMQDILTAHGVEIHYATEPLSRNFSNKPDVTNILKCTTIKSITRWHKILVSPDGEFAIEAGANPYTIKLDSEEGVNTLLKWIAKYRRLVKKLPRFVPTLTGGVDTRVLTAFWRNIYTGDSYYLKPVHPNTTAVEAGEEEMEIAKEVVAKLGLSLTRTSVLNCASINGLFTGVGMKEDTINDADYLTYIAHHYTKRPLQYGLGLIPFIDNLFLSIRHPEAHFMRTMLLLLLANDLVDIPLRGYTNQPKYLLREKFSGVCGRAEAFINSWGLKERVKEALA